MPDPHDATHAVGMPAYAALHLEAFFFQNAGQVFRRLELLEAQLAETEDAVHHDLRLFLHAVDLPGQIGLHGGFFFRGGVRLAERERAENWEREKDFHMGETY